MRVSAPTSSGGSRGRSRSSVVVRARGAESNLETRLSATRGRGVPLPAPLRSRFEPRLGFDFGAVRIHADAAAGRLSADVGARAFTTGRDIYFAPGEFAPEASRGERLIAHELAHVRQQAARRAYGAPITLQRATDPNFRIEGKFSEGMEPQNAVFFRFDSAEVDADQNDKVASLAEDFADQEVDLIGFASEEGLPSHNRDLAKDRARAVDKKLGTAGHGKKRNIAPTEERKAQGQIDYQRLRKVEVVEAGKPSTEPDCTPTKANPNPKEVSCGSTFTDAHAEATKLLDGGVKQMQEAKKDKKKKAVIDGFVKRFFGDESLYDTVLANLISTQPQVKDQVAHHRCHNTCDSTCQGALAYVPDGAGLGVMTTLCPAFDAGLGGGQTLVHEALHLVLGLGPKKMGTKDLAYVSERAFRLLPSARRLENTDHYVFLLRQIADPDMTFSLLFDESDEIDPGIKGDKLTKLRESLAFLQTWTGRSAADIGSLYDDVVAVRRASDWKAASEVDYAKGSMDILADNFGLPRPPKIPSKDDQVAIAGIYHRLSEIGTAIDFDVKVELDKTGSTRFEIKSIVDITLKLAPASLDLDPKALLSELLTAFVEAISVVSSEHKAKYVATIKAMVKHGERLGP